MYGAVPLANGCTPIKPVCAWIASKSGGVVGLFVFDSQSTHR